MEFLRILIRTSELEEAEVVELISTFCFVDGLTYDSGSSSESTGSFFLVSISKIDSLSFSIF